MDKIQTILELILALHAAAIIITNLTPTPKDDKAVARFYKWVEIFAGMITKKSKQSGSVKPE